MHLLPRMNVMLNFIRIGSAERRGNRKWKFLPIVEFEPQTCRFVVGLATDYSGGGGGGCSKKRSQTRQK